MSTAIFGGREVPITSVGPGLDGPARPVNGEDEVGPPLPGAGEDGPGRFQLVGLDQGLADIQALGFEKRVGHGAADQDVVGLADEVLDDRDLVGNLGPAQDGHVGLEGRVNGPTEVFDLFLSRNPAALSLTKAGIPTTEAWARWLDPKASLT